MGTPPLPSGHNIMGPPLDDVPKLDCVITKPFFAGVQYCISVLPSGKMVPIPTSKAVLVFALELSQSPVCA
jgi:hypothetical protein